ncbi:MAG: TolC family protein, partial [bacterium]|nr:TolC family protein [bacterium]
MAPRSIASARTSGGGASLDSTAALQDYLAYAAVNSPALKAAFYGWQAAVEKADYAGALPDPILNYAYFIENVETRVGPQEHRLSLKQTFPWFGTLGARKDMAAQRAQAAFEKYQSEKLKLFYRVKAAYYDFYFLGREIDLARENMALLSFWESVVRTRYRVALSVHPDLIKAQVELGKLEDRLQSLEHRLVPVRARLRAALGVDDTAPLPLPDEISVREVGVDREALVARALSDNSDLAAVFREIDRQRAAVRLAGKISKPRLTFGVDYIATGEALDPSLSDSGKDPWTVSVGISLPVWLGKNRAVKNEAVASLRRSEYEFEDQKIRLAAAAEDIIFRYVDALRRLRLYRDGLLPKAEQALNASYAAYQSG